MVSMEVHSQKAENLINELKNIKKDISKHQKIVANLSRERGQSAAMSRSQGKIDQAIARANKAEASEKSMKLELQKPKRAIKLPILVPKKSRKKKLTSNYL